MAEQFTSLPKTPQSNDTDASNPRRYSTGKPKEKAVPIYLRASTGSCHDFCKYGRKHEFEEKSRPPFRRSKAKKPPDVANSSNSLPEDKIMMMIKPKPNSNYKVEPKIPEMIKGEVSPVSLNRRASVSNSDKMASRVLLTKSVDRPNSVSTAKKKTAAREVLTESSETRVERTNTMAPNRKKTAAGMLRKSTESKRSNPAARKLLTKSIDTVSSIKLRSSLDSQNPKIIKQDMSAPSGKPKVSLKQVPSKVMEDPKCASSSKMRLSLPDSSTVSSGRRISDISTGHKTAASKVAAKGVHTSPRALLSTKSANRGIVKGQSKPKAPLSLKPTLKVQLSSRALLSPKASPRANKLLTRIPSLKTRNHNDPEVVSPQQNQQMAEQGNDEHQADPDQNELAQEKTLYVIDMKTESKALESENLSAELSPPPLSSAKSPPLPESSISSSHNEEESEYTATDTEDDFVSDDDEPMSLEAEQKRRDRKARQMHLEDKESQPFKLRFRQGRVIEIQPEHNTPRRLKFRRGRSISDNQNLKSDGRRSFKKSGADNNAHDGNSNSEKVVLRHQDAQGKKDAQGLFNNVIEETASKLVETRKSKVKALVGAFETVISLQDGKPTANTAS